MRIIAIKKAIVTWIGVVALAGMTMLFVAPAFALPAAQAVAEPLHHPTVTVTQEKIITDTITVTQTALLVVPTTQQVVTEKSVVLTKIEPSQYTMGFIVAGIILTLLGMWLFYLIGYRGGTNDSRNFVREVIDDIRER